MGVVARDEDDEIMASATWKFNRFEDVPMAKAMALYDTVNLAVECCFWKVGFEGDSETLMKIMRGTLDIPRTYVGNIEFSIKCRLFVFKMATFNHIGRLRNKLTLCDKYVFISHF